MLEFSISEFGFWYAHKTVRKITGPIPKKGDQVSFQIQKGKMHLFDEEGRRYINGKKQF